MGGSCSFVLLFVPCLPYLPRLACISILISTISLPVRSPPDPTGQDHAVVSPLRHGQVPVTARPHSTAAHSRLLCFDLCPVGTKRVRTKLPHWSLSPSLLYTHQVISHSIILQSPLPIAPRQGFSHTALLCKRSTPIAEPGGEKGLIVP